MAAKIDWSQFEVKGNDEPKVDWSQYESMDNSQKASSEDDEEFPIPEATGLSGVGSDLFSAALGAKDFAQDVPNKLEKLGGNILENPVSGRVRPLGQLAAEAGNIGKELINAPYNLNQYLARKHLLPQVLGQMGKFIPHLPEDMGVEKALGLEADPEKGDDLIRAIPDIAATVMGGVPVVKVIKKVFTAPSKETLFKRALEERIDEAANKTAMSKADLKALKESLRKDYSKIHGEKLDEATPIGQEEAINIKQGKIQKLKPDTEIPAQEVGEIPPEPDTKAIVAEKKANAEDARKAAEDVLGIKENPRLQAGNKLKTIIEDVKHKSSDLYNAARKHYVDQKIKVDNSKEIKAIGKDINELSANEGLFEGTTSEREALQAKINSLEGETVNASDLFDLQRTLEKMAENTRDKQYASGKGTTDLDRKRFAKIADNLEAHAKAIETRLESVGGKEVQGMIKEANKGWRTFKALEKKNPVGKGALLGEIPVRTMIDITKSHPGNDFLTGLIEADPDLKKQVLATFTGDSSVNKLLNPDNLTKTYLKALPEVDEHVNAFKQALKGVKEGEVKASKVKKEYDDLVKSMEDAAKEQKVRRDAIDESDKLKKQIKFHEDSIPKLKEKMRKVDENSAEHARLKKELSDHEKQLADKNHLLKKYGNLILKATGVSALMGKVGL